MISAVFYPEQTVGLCHDPPEKKLAAAARLCNVDGN